MLFRNPPLILNIISQASYNYTALEKIKGKPEQKFLVVFRKIFRNSKYVKEESKSLIFIFSLPRHHKNLKNH
jgi:hypothetical protein